MNLLQLRLKLKTIEEVLGKHNNLRDQVAQTIGLGNRIYVNYLFDILDFIPEQNKPHFLSEEISLIKDQKCGVLYRINEVSLTLLDAKFKQLSNEETYYPPRKRIKTSSLPGESIKKESIGIPYVNSLDAEIIIEKIARPEDLVIKHIAGEKIDSFLEDVELLEASGKRKRSNS